MSEQMGIHAPDLRPETALAGFVPDRVYRVLAAVMIFLGSFLLFQVQPIIAKQILPWFGGSAAVWTTCLLFFQGLLFFGYLYAHVLLTYVPADKQKMVHIALAVVSVAALPVIPNSGWKPAGTEDPIPRILGLLGVTLGMPYFLLSSTSPLVQGWLARMPGAGLPYRFYALSNVASLAALLAYPVLIEPFLTARTQALVWSGLFGLFVAISMFCAWVAPGTTAGAGAERGERPPVRERLLWLLLAAIPTILSLSVTNHLTQNVAAVPFLWILPLSVYLLSLILCFDSDAWYRRKIVLPLFGAMALGAAWMLLRLDPGSWIRMHIPFFTAFLFVACMIFHGELARRKPGASGLSTYYLMLSLGWAMGALIVAVGAPYLLKGNYEMPIALGVCTLVALLLEYRRHWLTDIAWAGVAIAAFVSSGMVIRAMEGKALVTSRSFYGGLSVVEEGDVRTMVHGTIAHGTQYQKGERRRKATTYYAEGSGVERAIEAFRRPGLRVGIIGLGAGTLAAYGRAGETFRFYELDPAVAELAQRYFTYISDSGAKVEIALGDGRLTLEREPEQIYDIFVVDAFSGDSIPVHLLSRESFDVYFRHLRPEGVLALHVSNSALNLIPVVARVAEATGRATLHIHALQDNAIGRSGSDWVLVAAQATTLESRPSMMKAGGKPRVPAGFPVWTDDRSNLFQILK